MDDSHEKIKKDKKKKKKKDKDKKSKRKLQQTDELIKQDFNTKSIDSIKGPVNQN